MKWYKFDEIPFPEGSYMSLSGDFLGLFYDPYSKSLYPYVVTYDYKDKEFIEARGEQYYSFSPDSLVAWTTIEEVTNDYDFFTIASLSPMKVMLNRITEMNQSAQKEEKDNAES